MQHQSVAHNQSDQISFLIVDTLVSPSLLHDCQSERFVSLRFCRLGGSWLREQDKNVLSFCYLPLFCIVFFIWPNLVLMVGMCRWGSARVISEFSMTSAAWQKYNARLMSSVSLIMLFCLKRIINTCE